MAQFGPCLFGVGAAVERFFDVRPAELDELQAARLAAVLPSPGQMRADDPGPHQQERTAEILALFERHRDAA